MKRIITLIVALTLVLTLLAGCGAAPAATTAATTAAAATTKAAGSSAAAAGTTAAAGAKKNVYFVSLKVGGAAWSMAQKGFETAIKELGWTGSYLAPTTANDASQMANLFETALTNKADAIMGPLYSKDVFGDMITRARKNGVKVACVNVNLKNLEDFWIGTDPVGSGKAQAAALAELVGKEKPAKVVYMVQDMSAELMQTSFNAFKEGLKDYPNIKIHGMEVDNNNPTTAAEKMANLVKADPMINAVICTNSSGASLGVANFIDENKLQDKFYTIGIDASADILNYVMSGALDCTLDQDFYKMGYQGVYMLKDLFDGKTVSYANDSGMQKVTAKNAVEYAAARGLTLKK